MTSQRSLEWTCSQTLPHPSGTHSVVECRADTQMRWIIVWTVGNHVGFNLWWSYSVSYLMEIARLWIRDRRPFCTQHHNNKLLCLDLEHGLSKTGLWTGQLYPVNNVQQVKCEEYCGHGSYFATSPTPRPTLSSILLHCAVIGSYNLSLDSSSWSHCLMAPLI